MENQEAATKRHLRVFALASFLNDMGSDIIYPVWPLFVTTVLKANMAASASSTAWAKPWFPSPRRFPALSLAPFYLSLVLTSIAAVLLFFVRERRDEPLPSRFSIS